MIKSYKIIFAGLAIMATGINFKLKAASVPILGNSAQNYVSRTISSDLEPGERLKSIYLKTPQGEVIALVNNWQSLVDHWEHLPMGGVVSIRFSPVANSMAFYEHSGNLISSFMFNNSNNHFPFDVYINDMRRAQISSYWHDQQYNIDLVFILEKTLSKPKANIASSTQPSTSSWAEAFVQQAYVNRVPRRRAVDEDDDSDNE